MLSKQYSRYNILMTGSKSKGFTILELMVSVAIFVFMTSILIAKFGNFNQSTLLTNLIYDVALAIRTEQTSSIGAVNSGNGTSLFQYPHGVHFTTLATPADPATDNTKIIQFSDVNSSGIYDTSGDIVENTYTITRGASVSFLCIGDESNCSIGKRLSTTKSLQSVDITFKRPDPSAIIVCSTLDTACPSSGSDHQPSVYVEIGIPGVSGGTRAVVVTNNGQVYILK